MKKSKLTLGISVAAMSCALLAGCNEVTYSPEGYRLWRFRFPEEALNF